MEYLSKVTIDRDNKRLIFNEEAIQSLDADSKGSVITIVASLKEEIDETVKPPAGGVEETLENDKNVKGVYILNILGATVLSEKGSADTSYSKELFPENKLRKITLSDDDQTGVVVIDDETISYIDMLFGTSTKELKLQYQENVVGDMKSLKDIFGIKGTFHKLSRMNSKKNIIGKSEDEVIEKVIKLKKEESK